MTKLLRRSILAGPPPLLLAACQGSPNPTLYTLAPVLGTARPGGPAVVVLREISVARYLERPNIIRSTDGYQLEMMNNDWWGEPIGAMITRAVVEELAQRLTGSTVLAETGAVGLTPDASVELDILRFDMDAQGAVVLRAQAAVTRASAHGHGLARVFVLHVTPKDGTVVAQVAAMSTALGQLADGLATMLTSA
jgi:uncharacterized protein